MSTVLFDAPGPRTSRRHRLYSLVAWVVLVALAAGAIWLMYVEGQLAYDLWEPFVTPAYIEVLIVDGLFVTLQMAAFAIIFALAFGVVFGVGKLSERAWIRWPSWAVVEFFRAIPLLLLIIFIFFAFFGQGGGTAGRFWADVIGLTLYNGAVLAEVFRAGINAVPRGQSEAAYALGMRKSQVMNIVLMPQAVKMMLPSIVSQCVVALKDTSLGYYIVAPGLTAVARSIWLEFDNQYQTVIVLAGIYIAVNSTVGWIGTLVQRRYVGERRVIAVTANEGGGA